MPSGGIVLVQDSLFRFLDTNGDGTGTKSANGNYAGAAEEFYIQPPSDEIYIINRMIIHIRDTTVPDAATYGNGITLTNGITVKVKSGTTDILDITDGIPIKSNAEWGTRGYDVDLKNWGTGDEFIQARWSFFKAGHPIILNGLHGHKLVVTVNDDLSGLNEHLFNVQGHREFRSV